MLLGKDRPSVDGIARSIEKGAAYPITSNKVLYECGHPRGGKIYEC